MLTTCLFLPKRGERYVLWKKPSHDGVLRRVPVGGRRESTDATLYETAAREAYEESGITPILEETILLAIVEIIHLDREVSNRLIVWFMGAFHGVPRENKNEGLMDPRAYTLQHLPVHELWPTDAHWLYSVLRNHHINPKTPFFQRRYVYERGVVVRVESLDMMTLALPMFPP